MVRKFELKSSMPLPVKILDSAKSDLKSLREKTTLKFGNSVWLELSQKFKDAFAIISVFPLIGLIPEEVEMLGIRNIRQILVNQTRVIYQTNETDIYIHMFVDTKRDFETVLYERLIKKIWFLMIYDL